MTSDDAADIDGKRLRRLIDSARIGIIEFDDTGRAVYVNRHWRELTGYTGPLPIEGAQLLELIHPEDRDHERSRWRDRTDGSYSSTLRFQRPDGTVRWVEIQLERVAGRGLETHVASLVDVTDRTEAEAALRASEHQYRRLVEQAPVGQVLASMDGTIVQVNRALAEILRADTDDLVGGRPDDFVHPDDLERVMVDLARLRSNETDRTESDLRVYRADNTLAWMRVATIVARDERDNPSFLHVAVSDITEQRAAEERLRASEQLYRTVVDSLHDGLLVFNEGRVTAANQSAADILGVSRETLLEDPTLVTDSVPVHPDGRPFSDDERPGRRAVLEGEPVTDVVMGVDVPGKGRRWLNMNAWPLPEAADTGGVVASISDITERKLAADALAESEERYRRLVSNSPLGQLVGDLDGRIVETNQALAEIIGRPVEALLGLRPHDLVHPDHLSELMDQSRRLLRGEIDRFSMEARLLRPDEAELWGVVTTTLLRDAADRPTHFLTLVQDITQRRQAEEESRLLARIIESTSDLVGVTDYTTGRLSYLNRAARQMFGFERDDITDVDSGRLYPPGAAGVFDSEIAPVVRRGESWTGEVDMRRVDGSVIQVLQTITGELDADGEIVRIWSVGRDITERKRKEVDLAHQATHDPLTDLPNRSLLLEHLELALRRTERSHRAVALLFLDLDRFKTVNDNLGHEAGDELLVLVSKRISGVMRPNDVLARLGGDEFVVLCEDVADEHQAVTIANRISAAIEGEPFLLGGARIDVTASIGIAISSYEHTHPEALLRDADAAMYRAKDLGRARHEVFDEAMRRRSARRVEVAEELARAIEHDHIAVHYQPIIDLRSGQVVGVEALARWNHPTRGTLPPYEFIGVAEESGLIVGLGLAVLSMTCDQVRRWEIERGSQAPRVHINLSARQLTHASLPSLIEGVLDQSLIDPDRICFEITESVLMEDAANSVASLQQLKEIGVEIAIDDFGTGYSSLAYLRRFPVDVLKVDRSFVDGLGPDPHDSSIVAAIVNLAHTLDLTCVAEGVETEEQLAGLQTLGCDHAQGYLFARPAPVPEVNQHLDVSFPAHPARERRRRRRRKRT